MSGESLTTEIVYSLLLMSFSGVSAWWSKYIIRNITAVRVSVFVGVSSAIVMMIHISKGDMNGRFSGRCEVKWTILESGIIEISLDKNLSMIEQKISTILGAPTFVRRPMDEMNSALWLLMDGSRSVRSIIEEMDDQFDEMISPVNES